MKNSTKQIKDFSRDFILVKVGKSFWDGKLSSEKAADAAADAAHAKRDKVEAKIIAIERQYLRPISGPMQTMTTLLKRSSRPWADGGWRAVRADDYPSLMKTLEELLRKVTDATQSTLKDKYKEMRAAAEKDLNGLIEGRFPSLERMLERYEVRIEIDTISPINDCRINGFTEADAEALAEKKSEGLRRKIAEGTAEMVRDLRKAVENLHEALADEKKRWQGSEETGYPLAENIEAQCRHIERLSIGDDEKATKAVADVRKVLATLDLTAAKDDKLVRKSAAKSTKTVVDALLNF